MNKSNLSTLPLFASIAAVIADETVAFGDVVAIESDDGPVEYTKVPQDDPNAVYGAKVKGSDGHTYTKNAMVQKGHVKLTAGRGGFTAQDAANACANLPHWARVNPETGAIVFGRAEGDERGEYHARSFHTRRQLREDPRGQQIGWCKIVGYQGLTRDGLSGAPYLEFKMSDPHGRVEIIRDKSTGKPRGRQMTRSWVSASHELVPDQRDEGMHAIENPHSVAGNVSARKAKKILESEAKAAAASDASTAAPATIAPIIARPLADGTGAEVCENPESLVTFAAFAGETFTGPDALVKAEQRARELCDAIAAQ